MRSFVFFMVSFCVSISGIELTKSQERKMWKVEAEKFRCVLSNIEQYKKQITDPVLIYLDYCPETDTQKILDRMAKNSAIPKIKHRSPDDTSPERVIVYAKRELDCLLGYELSEKEKLVSIPVEPCD